MPMFVKIETLKTLNPLKARVVVGVRLLSAPFGFTSYFNMYTGHSRRSERYFQYLRKDVLRQYAAAAYQKDDVLKLTRI